MQGTIFRLSLRTEKQATQSRLSSRSRSVESLTSMMQEFSSNMSNVLIFLRNISKISLSELRDDSTEPCMLFQAMLKNNQPDLARSRSIGFDPNNCADFSEKGMLSLVFLFIL